MNKPFLLISICERDTYCKRYETYEEAYAKMKKEFEEAGGDDETIEDGMAEIKDKSAWITDGNNHDDYDWLIIDLREDD